jgi:TRAP-type C4-dicarboxylate transport system permease small subunit
LKKLLTKVNQLFAEMSGWLLSIITLLLLLNLITRFFGIGVQGLLELTTFVFVAAIFLGLAHSEETDEHIKVEFIISRVPKKLHDVFYIFNYVIAVLISGILTYAAGNSALEAFVSKESVPGTTPLPTFPAKFTIFVGLMFFCLQAIINLYSFMRKEK